MRRVVAALVVVGLAIGVVLLWPRSDTNGPNDTVAGATTTTTTTSLAGTTSSPDDPSTTTPEDDHVVETVEEAEEILRELWFGWFKGIYHQDEERIREVVATEHQYELGLAQFGEMTFQAEPQPDDITYSSTQLLHATDNCTVIWTEATFTGFTNGTSTDVHVLRWDDAWRFFSLWELPDDLWEADCEAELD